MKEIRENYTSQDIVCSFQKGMESRERIDKKKVAELRKEIKKIRTKYNKLDPYTKRELYVLKCCLKTISRKVNELFGCEKLSTNEVKK